MEARLLKISALLAKGFVHASEATALRLELVREQVAGMCERGSGEERWSTVRREQPEDEHAAFDG